MTRDGLDPEDVAAINRASRDVLVSLRDFYRLYDTFAIKASNKEEIKQWETLIGERLARV